MRTDSSMEPENTPSGVTVTVATPPPSPSPKSSAPVTRKPLRLGVVGSRSYTNRAKVLKVVHLYKQKAESLGHELIVVSGGCPKGADLLAKSVALELGVRYEEYSPCHQRWNEYCIEPKSFYGKPYNVANYFDRNSKIAEVSDFLVAFRVTGLPCRGTMDTVNKMTRLGKGEKAVIFEDRCELT